MARVVTYGLGPIGLASLVIRQEWISSILTYSKILVTAVVLCVWNSISVKTKITAT